MTEAERQDTGPTGRPLRVLLVEDDEDDYILTSDLLTEAGAGGFATELEWARGFDEGLALMAQGRHDVFLLDYRLDGPTGLELLREAGRQGWRTPIILLTGLDDRHVDLEAMRAGAADYLPKGRIDAAALERSIRYALERKQAADALRKVQHEVQAQRDQLERRVEERTAELLQANARLAEADRRKDEFLAMMAHELRNPLAPVVNAVEILRHHTVTDPVVRQQRDLIARQVRHVKRLLDDLLDVSRIVRGKIELRRETVDLETVLAHAVEASRPLIESRRHSFELELAPGPFRLNADAVRLTQVFTNLLNNAAKYTEPGGRLRLTTQPDGETVCVCVQDNGIGLRPETLTQMFEPFVQGARAQQQAEGGLGVGLWLVNHLVTKHGGSVEAHSEGPGRGSEFVVRLPLSEEATVPAGPARARPARPDVPKRVLVVDDNVDAAESLAKLLRLDGHEVRTAYNGPAALSQASAYNPEVVLLDLGLPGMDGYEVARRLRQCPATQGAYLAAMTGYGQEEDRHRSLDAGFQVHLVKPVEPEAVAELLGRVGAP